MQQKPAVLSGPHPAPAIVSFFLWKEFYFVFAGRLYFVLFVLYL